ncbi:MFS transporter [Streptomyces sp. NPDC002817]|uniref:MFS transporter n=1 Tax=Streptomyces sp. NPDC088357 TaxID=3154655 RepID=UPI0034437CF5
MSFPPPLTSESSDGWRANVLVAVLAFTGVTVALVQTLIIPIIPHLPEYLDAPASDAAWALTATLLCGAVATPVMGRLGDMYGKRRMLLIGVAMMVAGSVICALSESLAPMIAGRALQGLSNGVIPLGVSILRDEVPTERLPVSTAVMLGSLGVGGALGLPAAALIADTFDWHVLFWTSAALGALALLLVLLFVSESKVRPGGRVDLTGAVGMGIGLACLLLAISKGTDWGWGDGTTLGLLAVALVVLPLWGWFELRTPQPMVDLRTSAHPRVLFTHLAGLAFGFALFALNLVLPQVLQLPKATGHGLGESLTSAGLAMAPQGLVMMAVAPLSARVTRTRGPKTTLMIGAVVVGVGYLLIMVMMSATWTLIMASCVVAMGVGFGYAALPTLVMESVPVSATAAANSLNALMRSIGTTTSSALAGVLLAHMTIDFHGVEVPSENGLRAVLAIGVGAAAVALAVASFIPRHLPDAEVSPGGRDGREGRYADYDRRRLIRGGSMTGGHWSPAPESYTVPGRGTAPARSAVPQASRSSGTNPRARWGRRADHRTRCPKHAAHPRL